SLQTSLDGTQWQTAYTMADSLGDVETLYFAPRHLGCLQSGSYSLQTSLDGTQWQTAYTMADSLGDVETLYFAP
ncbi:hypothetical protein C7E17_26640, partial [Stenotrophomonas maltophilia]